MLRHCYGPVGLTLVFLGLVHCAPAGAATAAELPAKAPLPRVDFSCAFATPHRLTVGRPDSSDRTLLDLQPGWLRMAWTYEDLTHYPLAAFVTPATAWDIHITPQLDGKALPKSRWTRLDGFLPVLDNSYEDPLASVRLKVLGGMTAALVRVEVVNRDQHPHQVVVRCESANWGENRGWVEPAHGDCDVLLAGWRDRADRVLLLGLGGDGTLPADQGPQIPGMGLSAIGGQFPLAGAAAGPNAHRQRRHPAGHLWTDATGHGRRRADERRRPVRRLFAPQYLGRLRRPPFDRGSENPRPHRRSGRVGENLPDRPR